MNDALGDPQTILLLGGGSEIGLAVATRLAAGKTKTVVLAGRRPDDYAGAATALRQAGADRVETVRFDATATHEHEKFLDDVVALVGDVDVAILAWGVLGDQQAAENDPAATVEVIETNFVGAASIGVVLAKRFRQQGHGVIVALSSVAGERARRSNFVYGSSKAGLDAFFSGLGDSLHGSGARVLVVRPGFVHTKMTEGMKPAPLSTTPDAVAEIVVEALASGAEQVWAPKPLRYLMSVLRHVPRPLFRRIPG